MSKKTFSVFGGTNREHLISALVPVISIILALVIGAIIIACLGKNPIKGYALLFSGSVGSKSRIAQTLMSACPLILPHCVLPLHISAAFLTWEEKVSLSWVLPAPL